MFEPRRRPRLAIALLGLIASAFLAGAPVDAGSQVPPSAISVSDTLLEIRLTDGSVLFGRIVTIDGDRVTIATESGGRIEVARSSLTSARPTRARLVGGERWDADPNGTRLFFGPTARAVGAGSGYFAVYELFLPYITVGITDFFSFSGGTPIVPEAMGEVFYLAPKVTVLNAERTQLAAGVLAFFGTEEDGAAGLLYGVGTFGSRDNAVSVGAAFPFVTSSGDGLADQPAIMIGAEARSSRRTKFITENYFVPGESGAIISGGYRFFGERLSADAGLGIFIDDGDAVCCIPLVNFVYTWGPPAARGRAVRAAPAAGSLAARSLATAPGGGTRTRR